MPALFPPRTGRGSSRPSPLLNQPPLKLRERRKEMEDELARRRGRVNGAVTPRAKAHLPSEQRFNRRHQVHHGPPEAIEAPDHQRVPWRQGLYTRL
jgi:hypothetical protein